MKKNDTGLIAEPLRQKAIILVFILFLPFTVAFSQDTCIVSYYDNLSILVSDEGNRPANYYRNLVIQDIALGRQVSMDSVQLRLNCSFPYRLEQCNPNRYVVTVSQPSCYCGPVQFKGFDISGSLCPSGFVLHFHVMNALGIQIDSLQIKYISQAVNSPVVFTIIHSRENEGFLNMHLDRAEPVYDENSYGVFRDKLLVINNYYAASDAIDSVVSKTDKDFHNDALPMPEIFFGYIEWKRFTKYVLGFHFNQNLSLRFNDPAAFQLRSGQFGRMDTRFNTLWEYELGKETWSAKNYDAKKWIGFYLDRIKDYYNRGMRTDYQFARFYEGLASMDFNNGEMNRVRLDLEKALVALGHKDSRAGDLVSLQYIWYNSLLSAAHQYLSEDESIRALGFLENARRFLHHAPFISSGRRLENEIDGVRTKIIRSYMDIADKLLAKGNARMAEDYFQKAVQFNTTSLVHPHTETMFIRFLKTLSGFYFEKGKRLNAESKFREAYANLDKALQISRDYPDIRVNGALHEQLSVSRQGIYYEMIRNAADYLLTGSIGGSENVLTMAIAFREDSITRIIKEPEEDTLYRRIQQIKYDGDIAEGLRFLGYKDYKTSLYYFQNASDIMECYCITVDTLLENYTRECAQPIIIDLISEGRTKVWGYFIGDGRKILQECKEMQVLYHLENDIEINGLLADLEFQITRKTCDRAEASYNDFLSGAAEQRLNGDFIGSLSLVDSALMISSGNGPCRIDDSQAWYEKVTIEPAAEFQQLEEKTLRNMHPDYSAFLAEYEELGFFYKVKDLEKLGLEYKPLFEFSMDQVDEQFLLYMAGYYIKLQDYDRSWEIVKRMYELNTPEQKIADFQVILGSSMAHRDYRQNQSEDPVGRLSSYCHGDKWCRPFRKAYEKAWFHDSGAHVHDIFLYLEMKVSGLIKSE